MARIIITGGGIGGLTAALCCLRHGHEVAVLEQAARLSEVGAGIQISPNAMKVFEALGVDRDLIASGFLPEAIELRMGVSGMELIRAKLGNVALERWGAPYLHIHRADLLQILERAVTERAPDAIRLGQRVTGYVQHDNGISAVLTDENRVSGDVLIGADGIHSAVRAQMLGPDQPTFTGNVAWRAVVPVERLGDNRPNPVAGAWMGRGKHAVTYLLRGGKLANFVGVIERDDWTTESWSEQGSREDALRDFAGWHPAITHMIEASDTLYRWALFDRPPLETWTEGRAALLGDAAHPMLPFLAQGAAMAAEDAWALAASLSKDRPVPEALKAYQDIRYNRASGAQAGSRANAKTFHQSTSLGRLKTYGPMWLAGRFAPGMVHQRQDWLYGYDIVREAT